MLIADATQATGPTVARVEHLRPNPHNPRGPISEADVAELVSSIQQHGIIEPLLVTPDGTVVCGHRRLLAARLAGLVEVPVVVRDLRPLDQLEIALSENIQRADLSPLQEAVAFRRLIDLGLSRADVTRRLGLNSPYVSGRMAILKCDTQVQELFGRRELPVTLAPRLARVANADQQRRLAARVATRRATVAETEVLIDRMTSSAAPVSARPAAPAASAVQARPQGLGRREAVALLKQHPTRSLTLADLLRAFDGACSICEECGMAELEVACRDCPGPRFVQFLAAKAR